MEAIQFAVDYGFQGVEIWSNVFDFAPGAVNGDDVAAIRTIAQNNHLSMAVHFIGDANLADINSGHLAESRRQLRETIRLCHDIGGEVVIIHPGIAAPLSVQKRHPLTQYPKFTLENIKKEAKENGHKGLFFREKTKRFYPKDSLLAQTLGFVNIDRDKAIPVAGIEKATNQEVSSAKGKIKTERDRKGRSLSYGYTEIDESKNGKNVC